MYDESGQAVPVPADQLPVRLPENVEFKPTVSRLCEAQKSLWRPCTESGARCIRESDTMDTFVDSSWYFLRYLSAQDEHQAVDARIANNGC